MTPAAAIAERFYLEREAQLRSAVAAWNARGACFAMERAGQLTLVNCPTVKAGS